MQNTYTPLKTKNGNVRLRVVGKPTSYTLEFAEGSDTTWTSAVTVDSNYLSVPPPGCVNHGLQTRSRSDSLQRLLLQGNKLWFVQHRQRQGNTRRSQVRILEANACHPRRPVRR